MQRYVETTIDRKGNATQGVVCLVYLAGTSTLATIYSDNGTTAISGSSVTSDVNGEVEWWAADGVYDMQKTATGHVTRWTRGIQLSDQTTYVYDVTSYGAIGDGATDDTAAIQATLDACDDAGGGTVHFPPGTYLISSPHLVIRYGATVTITGDNAWLDGADSADHAFVFDTGGGALYPTFERVEFRNLWFKRFDWRAIECSTYDTGGRSTVDRFVMKNCIFEGCGSGLFLYAKIGSAVISDNLFTDMTEATNSSGPTSIWVGSKYEADQAYQRNVIIKNNVVTGATATYAESVLGTDGNVYSCIRSHTADSDKKPVDGVDYATYWVLNSELATADAWVDGESYGVVDFHNIICFAQDALVDGNILRNNRVTIGGTTKGIGVKAAYATISNNIIENSGSSNDGMIYVKGVARGDLAASGDNGGESYAVKIFGNTILSTDEETWNASETGIGVDGGTSGKDNIWIHHNYIEGVRATGVQVETSTSSPADHDDISIDDNVIFGTRTKTGIQLLSCGDRLSICRNKISGIGEDGVSVDPIGIWLRPAGDTNRVIIEDNQIDNLGYEVASGNTYGIYCRPYSTNTPDVSDVSISRNSVNLTGSTGQRGIYLYLSGGTLDGVTLDHNRVDVSSGETDYGWSAGVTGVIFETISSGSATAAADDVTPSVRGLRVLNLVANSGATTVTGLDDGVAGQVVVVVGVSGATAATIADCANIATVGAATWTSADGATLTLLAVTDTSWIELARSAT